MRRLAYKNLEQSLKKQLQKNALTTKTILKDQHKRMMYEKIAQKKVTTLNIRK